MPSSSDRPRRRLGEEAAGEGAQTELEVPLEVVPGMQKRLAQVRERQRTLGGQLAREGRFARPY